MLIELLDWLTRSQHAGAYSELSLGRRIEGVRTIPGVLSYHLDQLDLRRNELARRVGVNVRTIHNIEHGSKLVSKAILGSVASILTQCWSQKYPANEVPLITAECFSSDPVSIGTTFLTALALNQPQLIVNDEHSLMSQDAIWSTPGDQNVLRFAGTYSPDDMHHVLSEVGSVFSSLAFENPKILIDPSQSIFMVRTTVVATHPESNAEYSFRAYMEMTMGGKAIEKVQGIYDDIRLAEFCASGVVPIKRKSGL